jgi:hypothetical protein
MARQMEASRCYQTRQAKPPGTPLPSPRRGHRRARPLAPELASRCHSKNIPNYHGTVRSRMQPISPVGILRGSGAEDICRQLESVAQTGRLAEQLAAVIKNLLR